MGQSPDLAAPRAPAYRFVALGVVWSAYLVVFLSRLCVGPLAPFLKQSFDLSNAQVGGLTSATALTYAPTLLVAGWLVDRIGSRRALVFGTLITGVAVGAVALSPSYGTMLILLAASGFGCGFIYPTAVKAIMLWFPASERATAVGVNQSAVNVSGMLGAAIMPAIAAGLGWRYGFVTAAALALLVCALAVWVYHDPDWHLPLARRTDDRGTPVADARAACVGLEEQGLPCLTGDARADRAAVSPGILTVLHSRDILLMGGASFFLCIVEFSALAHLVLFLNVEWGYTVAAAGGLLALCQGTGAIGKPLSGLISDRSLRRRRRPALVALAVLSGLSCVVLATSAPGAPWVLWIALGVLGVGAVGWGGLFSTLAGETAGSANAGAAAGATAAMNNLGIFAGPPLFGLVVDRAGGYALAWWAMAAASAAAAVLLCLVHERRSSDLPAA